MHVQVHWLQAVLFPLLKNSAAYFLTFVGVPQTEIYIDNHKHNLLEKNISLFNIIEIVFRQSHHGLQIF
jgi:hypothetical protein